MLSVCMQSNHFTSDSWQPSNNNHFPWSETRVETAVIPNNFAFASHLLITQIILLPISLSLFVLNWHFSLFLPLVLFANNPTAASIYRKQYGLITDSRANQGAPSPWKCKWRLRACRDWLQGESSPTVVSLLCQTNTCCSKRAHTHTHTDARTYMSVSTGQSLYMQT